MKTRREGEVKGGREETETADVTESNKSFRHRKGGGGEADGKERQVKGERGK